MQHEVMIAGFGGQGVLFTGVVLAYAGLEENKHVSWLPSYGPEMRGGTANCMVVVSETPVASPYISIPDAIIAMNQPSVDKFQERLNRNGILLYNSSAAAPRSCKPELRYIAVPCTELALEKGSGITANMIALGAYLKIKPTVSLDAALSAVSKALPERRRHLLGANQEALLEGYRFFDGRNYPAAPKTSC